MLWRRAAAPILLMAIVVTASQAFAQQLQEELLSLLSQHPQILEQQARVESARKGIKRAFSGYLPRIDLNGNVGPATIDTDQRRDLGLPQWSETQTIAGVTVTQNLFNGFETPSQVRIARLQTAVAEATLEGTRQNVLFDGINAYLDVLRQKQLLALARLNEESIKLQARLEDERVERGAGIAVDVLSAKSRLQIAKEERVAFEGSLDNAVSRYIQVFNHAPDVDGMSDPVPPEHLLPATVDESVDVATNENPAITSSLSTVEVAAERRRLARSGYFPTIDVVANANYEEDFDLRPGRRTDYSLLLQATWNLFNGFATSASVAQSAYDYRASQDNHNFVVRSVVQSTRTAWQQLVTARQRVDLLENAVNIAAEVLDARRRLRQAGKETVVNVLLAEAEVNRARISLTDASYDAVTAVYRLLQSMGRLNANSLGLRSK